MADRFTSITNIQNFSQARQNSDLYTSIEDYRKQMMDDISKYQRKLDIDDLEYKKQQINAEYDYWKARADKKLEYDKKLFQAEAKLKAKYGISDDGKEIDKRLKDKYDKELKAYKDFLDKKKKLDDQYEANAERREMAQAKRDLAGAIRGGKISDIKALMSNSALSGADKAGALIDGLASKLSDFAKKLDNTIDTIGGYQSRWDTRLYGYGGTNYRQINKTVTGAAGVSPLVQQAKIMQNIDNLIGQGIAFNVEQRAFLQTISDKIATTFDAANGTLLQLVRVQQQDTTAARLGLEAGVTKYLNNMFSSSEYMSSLYKTVLGNIYETSSLFSGKESIGFEYQVQKWLGSLYSVGMSQGAVSNIASAIGQLGSGNISALSGNTAMQNLLVMAASRGGLSYADLLTGGLSGSSVNKLMEGLVTYMGEVASGGNNVVKSQLANIFGMSISDLKAIANLSGTVASIAKSGMNYGGAMSNLTDMANSMYSRTSMGEIMSNLWANTQYSMASGIASNPVLYAIYKAAGLLDTVAGGIALPDIKYVGTGVNLQTTVADLMRVTALSGGIMSSIANMIGSAGNGGLTGAGLLRGFNVGGNTVVTRGAGNLFNTTTEDVSRSNMVGSYSGTDMQESLVNEENAKNQQKLVELKEENEEEIKLVDIHNDIERVIEVLTVTGITVAEWRLTGSPSGLHE